MQSFMQYSPTKIIFGKGAEDKAAQEIKAFGAARILIVYGGGSIVRSGLLARIEEQFQAAGLCYQLLGGVQPNPLLSFARNGVKAALDFGCDFVLAIGGGSAIDTAKAIAIGAANPQDDIWDFWLHKKEVTKALPVGCILTISAAGSETSDSAVLTNSENQVKMGLSTDFNRPKLAFMNPELTYTLPDYQVACGIVDIMMHTLDRYFTHTKGNAFTDAVAEALLRTTIYYGKIAMQNKCDYDAMSELMWCGSISHNGLTGLGAEKDFAPHKLGHELSAKFGVAHGASLSTVWGAWATYAYREEPERFAQYAKNVWGIQTEDTEKAALAAIDATVLYFKQLGMPVCFSDLDAGIQLDEVVQDLAHRCTARGPVAAFKKIYFEDAYAIYKLANV